MGTRGAYGFRVDGIDKITYNHFDSYPESLGKAMIRYVASKTPDQLAEVARRLVLVDVDDKATPELVERYKKRFSNTDVGDQDDSSWYCLLREAQGEPSAWDAVPGLPTLDHMIDGHEFLANSLFCEWAYIINVDDGVLEVYKGFNKDPDAPGRYAALTRERPSEYRGVRLLTTVALAFAEQTGGVPVWDTADRRVTNAARDAVIELRITDMIASWTGATKDDDD